MRLFLIIVVTVIGAYSTLAQQQSITLRPGPDSSNDAMVWSINPNSNYGKSPEATLTAWTYLGAYSVKRYYLKFDLSAIPQGSNIDSAFLYLFNNPSSSSHGGDHFGDSEFQLQLTASAWNENVITFNNQPEGLAQPTIVFPAAATKRQDFKLNVANMVEQQIHTGLNHGFYLRIKKEETYRSIVCASSNHPDSSKRPMLVVYYDNCNPLEADFSSTKNKLGNSFRFTPSTNRNYTGNYNWDFGDGSSSTLLEPNHQYKRPGMYNVCLSVADSCGSDLICKTVFVTGKLLIGPTPSSDIVYWQSNFLAIPKLTIFNSAGQLITQIAGDLRNGQFSVEHLAAGIYYFRFDTDDGRKTKKVIIRH